MSALIGGEVRRRGRGAAAVGVVLGLGFTAVLAAAAGARRTESAFPRMLEATRAPQLLVSSANPDPAQRRDLYRRVAALDGVETSGLFAGVGLVPLHVPRGRGTVVDGCSNLSLDAVAGYGVDRANVIHGRLPRRDRADEVLVTHDFAETFGVAVGDEVELAVNSEDQALVAGEPAPGADPVPVTIVGVGVLADSVVPVSDLDRAPRIVASPAFTRRVGADDQDQQCYDGAVVRLAPGADVDGIVAEIDRLGKPSGGAFVQDRTRNYADVRRAIQPQVTALWLFAATVACATLLVAAQLLGRQVRQAVTTSAPVWRAVGATGRQVAVLAAAPAVVSSVVATGLATVGALLLSGRFPIGPARLAEPDRGMTLDLWVHPVGALLVAAAPVLIAVAAASLARRDPAPALGRGWLARIPGAVSKPAVAVGVHLAAGSRRGEAAVPVRSAGVGVSVAIAAAVATVAFAAALDDLVSEPHRYGRDWDVMVDGVFAPSPVARVLDELGDDPSVAAVAGGRYGEVTVDGRRVPTVGLTDLVGRTFPAVIDGREAGPDGEIVVGERTLRELGRSVGERVTVDTGTGPREMTVVGTAAFPRLNHGSFSTLGLGTGAVVRTEAFPPYPFEDGGLFPPDLDAGDFVGPGGAHYEFVTIRVDPAASEEARRRVLATAARIGAANQQVVRTEQRPIAIDNYAEVRSTPVVLALLLGSMAAATLAHLVLTVVRRRRRDLAVCAALGMRRSQLSAAVVIQALLVAGVAVVVGVPTGLAGGRLAWAGFTSDLGVPDAMAVPLLAIGSAVAAAVALSVAVAVVPAVAAGRRPPAAGLRSE